MNKDQFKRMEKEVITHLGDTRRQDFALTLQMFEVGSVIFGGLSSYLIVEELRILVSEMKRSTCISQLRQMYHALKLQARKASRVVVACY